MKNLILDRFLRYVQIDTQSEFAIDKIPSTDKQFKLANILKTELEDMGMQDVELDSNCYIMAPLPSNVDHHVPTIGFVAHIDTSPDFTATGCKPKVWENYQGDSLLINPEKDITLSVDEFPEIKQYIGQTIITTDGTTLLGADDKAGVTEIMSAMDHLLKNPDIKHGRIRICFTPDEEVGKGADLFDVKKFGAEWAYTMDGSIPGEIEYENFNAAYAEITIQGKIVHPGMAKDKMINANYIACQIAEALRSDDVPEKTDGYEGFIHLTSMEGDVDTAKLAYIIRDHDLQKFESKKEMIQHIVDQYNSNETASVSLNMFDQYYNMYEKVKPVMHIVEVAKKAITNLGMAPITKPIRGGTDGSRLSYMGLPCPNIFAGGMNFHSRFEYVSLQSMEKATDTIVEIARLVAEKTI